MEKFNLLLFSRVKAKVVRDGEPVVGAKIERSTFWNMEKYPRIDITYTNEQGEFELPEVRGSADYGWLARLFNQPTVSQWVFLKETNEKEVLLYSNSRGDHEAASETGYEVIQFKCDLNHITEYMPGQMMVDCEVEVKHD